ncbi:MAG: hypothetical protein WC444_04630 [Candidatus Paceibacterota bacterium]
MKISAQEVLPVNVAITDVTQLQDVFELSLDEAMNLAMSNTRNGILNTAWYEGILAKLGEIERDAFTLGLASAGVQVINEVEELPIQANDVKVQVIDTSTNKVIEETTGDNQEEQKFKDLTNKYPDKNKNVVQVVDNTTKKVMKSNASLGYNALQEKILIATDKLSVLKRAGKSVSLEEVDVILGDLPGWAVECVRDRVKDVKKDVRKNKRQVHKTDREESDYQKDVRKIMQKPNIKDVKGGRDDGLSAGTRNALMIIENDKKFLDLALSIIADGGWESELFKAFDDVVGGNLPAYARSSVVDWKFVAEYLRKECSTSLFEEDACDVKRMEPGRDEWHHGALDVDADHLEQEKRELEDIVMKRQDELPNWKKLLDKIKRALSISEVREVWDDVKDTATIAESEACDMTAKRAQLEEDQEDFDEGEDLKETDPETWIAESYINGNLQDIKHELKSMQPMEAISLAIAAYYYLLDMDRKEAGAYLRWLMRTGA